jgi:hypothetical protein
MAKSPEKRIYLPDSNAKLILGWREWAGLPEFGIQRIKAKVDTGARTSALHAYFVEDFYHRGTHMVRFGLHPLQRNKDKAVICEAEITDHRWVSDSGGHREKRFVIFTEVSLGDYYWPIEITLTNRDTMRFRMLLGRTAVAENCTIQPGSSYILGKRKKSK